MDAANELYDILEKTISTCKSKSIALSGGLDSSILAYHLRDKKPQAIAIIAKDFLATDLTYSQLAAKEFDIPFKIKSVTTEELLTALEECIKILKNFNDIEIRNSVVIYLALKEIKNSNEKYFLTGDGADELFAGYSFFLKKSEVDLENDLKRIWSIMHFPSLEIGKALGITVESPFLDETVVEFAKKIPVKLKVGIKNGKKYGKFILRQIYEDKIPKAIVWREKSPLQDGAGTVGLTELFSSVINDSIYQEKKKTILESDQVQIRSKESLHYYEIYRKYFDEPSKLHSSDDKCPYCQFSVGFDSRFCRMCGAFPI